MFGVRAAPLSSFGSGPTYYRVLLHLRSKRAGPAYQLTRLASNQAHPTVQEDEDSRRFRFRALRRDGTYEDVQVLPTPKANRQKLESDLRQLNLGDKDCPHRWYLDRGGDAIHAVRVGTPPSVDSAIEEIHVAFDAKRHHAHISRKDIAEAHKLQVVTFTCTTHKPHGLGVADTTLAKKIDSILGYVGFSDQYKDSEDSDLKSQVATEIDATFQRHVEEHRRAAADARQ